VEQRYYPDGTIDTGHSASPVPFILIPPQGSPVKDILKKGSDLTDVAPTVLELMGIPLPQAMTGQSLLKARLPLTLTKAQRPRILLLILDGWGHHQEDAGNLIAKAHTPVMNKLFKDYPWTTLSAAGKAVGMPEGSVGNSESGHLHLGAGRRIPSDRVRIDEAISDASFSKNPSFLWAMEESRRGNKPLHLLGIVSFYSSHGSIEHLFALMDMAKQHGVKEVYIHCLLGRRGERPESGAVYVDKVEQKAAELGLGEVVTVMGRYWAMDREENWDRVEKAYRALVCPDQKST
jgi:2,3-bisphosphoglycerate-independent phosphoglycerate mutase